MWEEGERMRLGKIVVVDGDEDDGGFPDVFMLYDHVIFRYNMVLNRWLKETSVPRRAFHNSAYGFVALNRELHVMTLLNNPAETSRARENRKGTFLYIQIYNPRKNTWRYLFTKPPFLHILDFQTAVMCPVRV